MDTFTQIATRIIREQEDIIGPLAWTEARKVQGLSIDAGSGKISISDPNPKGVVDRLVNQYERLFGLASRAVCHEAAAGIVADMPSEEVPTSLR